MKKKFLSIIMIMAIAVVALGNVCMAQPLQDRIGTDKAAHFAVSYLLNDTLYRYTKMTQLERFLTVAAIGAAKEKFVDSHFDKGDFAADMLGAICYEIRF